MSCRSYVTCTFTLPGGGVAPAHVVVAVSAAPQFPLGSKPVAAHAFCFSDGYGDAAVATYAAPARAAEATAVV